MIYMSSELSRRIAEKIIDCRKQYNYTQKFVAEKLGITENSYAHYEKGRAEPSVDSIYLLCTLYDENIDEWLGTKSNDTLTKVEKDILAKYRKLDSNGQERITAMLKLEHEQVSRNK